MRASNCFCFSGRIVAGVMLVGGVANGVAHLLCDDVVGVAVSAAAFILGTVLLVAALLKHRAWLCAYLFLHFIFLLLVAFQTLVIFMAVTGALSGGGGETREQRVMLICMLVAWCTIFGTKQILSYSQFKS